MYCKRIFYSVCILLWGILCYTVELHAQEVSRDTTAFTNIRKIKSNIKVKTKGDMIGRFVVSPDGAFYWTQRGKMYKADSTGSIVKTIALEKNIGGGGIAVDDQENVFVVSNSVLYIYNKGGKLKGIYPKIGYSIVAGDEAGTMYLPYKQRQADGMDSSFVGSYRWTGDTLVPHFPPSKIDSVVNMAGWDYSFFVVDKKRYSLQPDFFQIVSLQSGRQYKSPTLFDNKERTIYDNVGQLSILGIKQNCLLFTASGDEYDGVPIPDRILLYDTTTYSLVKEVVIDFDYKSIHPVYKNDHFFTIEFPSCIQYYFNQATERLYVLYTTKKGLFTAEVPL